MGQAPLGGYENKKLNKKSNNLKKAGDVIDNLKKGKRESIPLAGAKLRKTQRRKTQRRKTRRRNTQRRKSAPYLMSKNKRINSEKKKCYNSEESNILYPSKFQNLRWRRRISKSYNCMHQRKNKIK